MRERRKDKNRSLLLFRLVLVGDSEVEVPSHVWQARSAFLQADVYCKQTFSNRFLLPRVLLSCLGSNRSVFLGVLGGNFYDAFSGQFWQKNGCENCVCSRCPNSASSAFMQVDARTTVSCFSFCAFGPDQKKRY